MAKDCTFRDEEKYHQALTKAINGQETPVKQKHVRSAIIGTFHRQGAAVFWAIAVRLPAMDDRIVAWKLCHVVHKVLREGHPLCLVDSQRQKGYLDEIGKLWCHLHDGYGRMIRLYTTLLMTKLEFHKRNPRFPGHLGVTSEELESIAANDINNYFEMSVEMFDYLDNILDLQLAVYGSLNMARSNSMTNAGQCRLAPLVPCIQDASRLYDYCVKILFKLHDSLPPDTLSGHRERFRKIFKLLKDFYNNTQNMQYFKDLISISSLPESPPNFLKQSEFRSYVPHEVVVPQEPEDESVTEGSLIDTTEDVDNFDAASSAGFHMNDLVYQQTMAEKEILEQQCERLRIHVNDLTSKSRKEIEAIHNRMKELELELAAKDSELAKEKGEKEELMNQAFQAAQIGPEQKAKEEKFNKLKDFYYKLREEHIQKLRENSEVKKKLDATTQRVNEIEQDKISLDTKIKEMHLEMTKTTESLQKSATSQNEELENLKKDKELFNMETEILKKSINDACKERATLQEELNKLVTEKEELKKQAEKTEQKLIDLEKQIETLKSSNNSLLKEIVQKSLESCELILKHAIHEVDNPAVTALTCSTDYLGSLTQGCIEYVESSKNVPVTEYAKIIVVSNQISHRLATFIIHGKATSNTSPDISFGDKMAESCKILGEIGLKILLNLKQNKDTSQTVQECVDKLYEIATLADTVSTSLIGEKLENLADMLERELSEMDKAIEESSKRIQDMLTNSRAADSGIKLEVNEKILDSCTGLMQAIKILVEKSRLLQAEIVAQGRGTSSAKEFYKRNHQWTDGFLSAAKAVAAAATFLVDAADKVVTSNGKLEQLVVAAQEISASTAQLVVASRVKADRHSKNLHELTQASKGVTSATGAVLATAKDCSQLIEEKVDLDTTNLTLHQAKKLEMEKQVRVLELEKELEQERMRLSALRRHHYQLAGES